MFSKNKLVILSLFILALTISACTTGKENSPDSTDLMYDSPFLEISYPDALSVRLQLTLGILQLSESDYPLEKKSAAELLPLWQALQNISKSGNSASAEVNALLQQIETTLSQPQMEYIRDLQLTQTDMQTWASANGITFGIGGGTGQGQGRGMSPEQKATRQAAEGKTPNSVGSPGGAPAVLTDVLIRHLEKLVE